MSSDHDHPHPHPHEHPHPAPGGIVLSNARPILSVASVPASLAYYGTALGFSLDFAWADATQFAGGAPPTFAQVSRGGWEMMLAEQSQGAPGMWVHVDVDTRAQLEALYHEYQQSGARVSEPPQDRPWGRREMRVQDLDGHTFRLSPPLHD
jgi:uncharacterized glyoxalase superfamily protein PhnB